MLRPKRPVAYASKQGMRPASPLEDVEQRIVVNWLELYGVPFFAVPNGGHRHPAVAKKLKAQGARRGVPDLILPVRPPLKHGITAVAIEMKREGGVPSDVSPEQRAWMETLTAAGWRCIVAFGAKHAIRELETLGYGPR